MGYHLAYWGVLLWEQLGLLACGGVPRQPLLGYARVMKSVLLGSETLSSVSTNCLFGNKNKKKRPQIGETDRIARMRNLLTNVVVGFFSMAGVYIGFWLTEKKLILSTYPMNFLQSAF